MLLNSEKLDPRVIRTRRDLVGSMCTLMREKPFNKISVQDITEEAIINRATFYAHFEDKYALLEYLVLASFEQKLNSRIRPHLGFTPENLRFLTLTTCEFLEEFNDRHSPRQGGDIPPIERMVQPHIYKLLLSWIEESDQSKPEGQLKESSCGSPEVIALVTSWSIFGPALEWSYVLRNASAEVRTDQIMTFLTHGITDF
ncbi:MAG: TetR/AcrR family transcriptional regulator [Anaerolineae bacterium]